MANGDDALAAGIPTVPPNEDLRLGYDQLNRILDIIVNRKQPINRGGTGATTPSEARQLLEIIGTNIRSNGFLNDSVLGSNLQADVVALGRAKADRPDLPGRAVMDVDGSAMIGLRWNGTNPVIRVNEDEWELVRRVEFVSLADRVAALEARP